MAHPPPGPWPPAAPHHEVTPTADATGVPRWLSVLGTVVAVCVSAFSSLGAAAFYAGEEPSDLQLVYAFLGILNGLGLAACLVLRQRYPVAVCLVASAAPVLLPLDSVAALIALPWVLASAPVRRAVLCTGAVVVATAVAVARDVTRPPERRLLAWDDGDGALVAASPLVVATIALLLLGVSIAAGMVRRQRAAAVRERSAALAARLATAEAQAATDAETARSATLQDRMSRQEERELIAREVHDTVAHHIAAISLQASAFEVQRDDPEARDVAREVRTSAQQAVSELRTLLDTLRDSDGSLLPGTTLEDLVPLLDRIRDGGANISSSVFVADSHLASPSLTRATFRIVQEAATNALKHAPGEPVSVMVRATRTTGVDIRVSNPAPGAGPPHEGHGVTGMSERAARLGGTLRAEHDGAAFVVTAHLPWSEPDPAAEPAPPPA